ncbi:gamma-glutamylcyclotransferase family protein [Bacillus cereus group sp. MYBK71-2]|uniref:gamma-glutamylcyclotransferase family protein n=1 Tax=Bacillus cereus group TaxID=86661 RepID=UPI000CD8FC3E|nr:MULTISPECIES: gamma-glutamylcyclotransferase family protein [Bacillus cereus group]MCC2340752.1 gamma-glutamylcyclotransferase [Bacillus tropicus]MCU5425553.1 gamma-glutamylcyclotransferase [Bacillus tropicus]MDA1650774.1 gamma-glutamylcyclotransferase [Bacillus cereus group sp. TH160LC]MDA1778735.1 gamma-glutamylcyclotransferase [Bacillus cereus group sp. BY9-3LC]MDA1800956.1 gamma-glutamylcyclotransferase [Bacillus cereus group sp. BY6-1LC]
MHYVFVYGTLRKEQTNAHYMQGAICIADKAWTYGKLFDTNEGYPAMTYSSEEKVYGEVYEVNDEILHKLDDLEEYTGNAETDLYDRITQTVYATDREIEAYVYIAQDKKMILKVIDSGDWVKYQKVK